MSDSPQQRVDYQALKAWIAAQEAYEAATNSPAPLTPAQRKAVAELSKPNPSPPTQGVVLGNMDYISRLQHYASTFQAAGTTLTYSNPVAVPSTTPSPLWTQTLTLTLTACSTPLVFPSAKTGGLVQDPLTTRSNLPSFPRVKDAKKYAAQTCVSYLVAQNHLVPSPTGNGELVPAPSLLPQKRKGVPTNGALGTIDARDDSIPATQRVTELCRKLALQAPSYELVPGTGQAGVWDGEANFGRDAFRVPDGIGQVEGVFGKRNARERMAEEVLEYLLSVQENRERKRRIVEGEDD